jgi:hypothetical protein
MMSVPVSIFVLVAGAPALILIMRQMLRNGQPLLPALTVSFFIVASITTFDKRLTQGLIRLKFRRPGLWTGAVAGLCWVEGGLKVALFLLNWKYGLLVYLVGFALAVFPVLETVGSLLMAPLKWFLTPNNRRLARAFLTRYPDLARSAFPGLDRRAQPAEVEVLITSLLTCWSEVPQEGAEERLNAIVEEAAKGLRGEAWFTGAAAAVAGERPMAAHEDGTVLLTQEERQEVYREALQYGAVWVERIRSTELLAASEADPSRGELILALGVFLMNRLSQR